MNLTTLHFLAVYGTIIAFGFAGGALAHGPLSGSSQATPGAERVIDFPDVAGKQTLVVDLHTHSVFSDGHVWPKIRVAEALKDGLDALAVTEHLEYQPHRADLPHTDRNRSYQEASVAAQGSELLIINGSEITREAPAGHINAVFIEDANRLITDAVAELPAPANDDDVVAYYLTANEWPVTEAVAAANDQGGFVFWNHPYWTRQKPDGLAKITKLHRQLARKGQLHGIEIANGRDYSEEAFKIALKHKLALIGTSDVHDLIDWDYAPHSGGHRPVTLVFAENRSRSALRDALFAKRTVVWFKNLLIGRAEEMTPLLQACLSITGARYLDDTQIVEVDIENRSDARFELDNTGRYTFMHRADHVTLPAHATTQLWVKPGVVLSELTLDFEVVNALVAPRKHPRIALKTGRLEAPVESAVE